MTDISADFLTYLKAQSSITAITGSGTSARIYPDLWKEGASKPGVVYQRKAGSPVLTLAGRSRLNSARFDVLSIAASRAAADALDGTIYTALIGGNKTMGSTSVTEIYVGDGDRDSGADPAIDGSDQHDYWARTSYTVWYVDDGT